MNIAEQSRSVVETTIATLRDEFGRFDVLGETMEVSRVAFGRKREQLQRGRIGSASVLVSNEDEVLMVRLSSDPEVWSIPKGPIEGNEHPTDGAHRAVDDFTGVACSLQDIFQVRKIQTTMLNTPNAPTLHDLQICFEGTYERGFPRPCGDVEAVNWRSSPPRAVEAPIRSRIDEWAQGVGPSPNEGTSAGT